MKFALTDVSNLIEIITNIFVIIGGVVAIWQYILNVRTTSRVIQKEEGI